MAAPVISVEGLGKSFILKRRGQGSARDALHQLWQAPKRALGIGQLQNVAPDNTGFWALRDITFEVKPGEVLGVVGRNGAGKSVLFKILSHITRPSTGRVTIHGSVAPLLEVGTGFRPELTGRENIYLNGVLLGMRRAEVHRHLDQIIAFAEMDDFIDTAVKTYSSGMRMRLAFAVAAHLDREIFLMDEVLAVGDANFRAKCVARLQSLAKQGRTVLFVSHGAGIVEGFCSRALLLERGRLLLSGTPAEVHRHYDQIRKESLLETAESQASRVSVSPASTHKVAGLEERPARFIVLGHERSGSNLACWSLDYHYQIGMMGEALSPKESARAESSGSRHQALWKEGQDGAEFLDQHMFPKAARDGVRAYGFKLFYHHARSTPEMETAWDYIASNKDIRIIHLIRRNLLECKISLEIANRTGQWFHQGLPRRKDQAMEPFALDPKDCEYYFDRMVSMRQWAAGITAEHPTLNIEYEKDLCSDFPGTMLRVYRFLGVAEIEARAELQKQRILSPQEQISNYAELRHFFRHSQHARYFTA